MSKKSAGMDRIKCELRIMSQSMGDTSRKMSQTMSQKTGVLLQHDCLDMIGQRESGHSRKTSQVVYVFLTWRKRRNGLRWLLLGYRRSDGRR